MGRGYLVIFYFDNVNDPTHAISFRQGAIAREREVLLTMTPILLRQRLHRYDLGVPMILLSRACRPLNPDATGIKLSFYLYHT
jgi:hypothetical protein